MKSPLITKKSEVSQGDSQGGKEASGEKKWDRGGRETAGDVAPGRSVEAFQFGDVGSA